MHILNAFNLVIKVTSYILNKGEMVLRLNSLLIVIIFKTIIVFIHIQQYFHNNIKIEN